MGRRKLAFTKREYERLSKTHEGRMKIKRTYFFSAIACFAIFAVLIIIQCLLDARLDLGGIYTKIGLWVGCPACVITIIVAIYYYIAIKNEEKDEIIRKQEEARIRKIQEERAAAELNKKLEEERLYIERLRKSNIEAVDRMSGIEFEDFVASVLKDLGYTTAKTRTTGDFGADLILVQGDEKIIVQLKRYAKKVSVSAIQEIKTAENYYKASKAWVITNNYFTAPAKELAQANDIKLIDRDSLMQLIIQANDSNL